MKTRTFSSGAQGNKEYMTLGFIDEDGILDEVKELWKETTCKPKLITLTEAIDRKMITQNFWRNKTMVLGQEEDQVGLMYKVWFLFHDIREKGLWSPPNGVLRKGGFIHFHPGPNRVKALCLLDKVEEYLMIWDPLNQMPDKPELDFDEWLSYFTKTSERTWFSRCKKFIGDEDEIFMLEAHIEQHLTPFKNMAKKMKEVFKNTQPLLRGKCTEEVEEHVLRDGGEHGVEIHVKDDHVFTIEDMEYLIEISDEVRLFENDKVRIIVK